jgi:hypothetical protein
MAGFEPLGTWIHSLVIRLFDFGKKRGTNKRISETDTAMQCSSRTMDEATIFPTRITARFLLPMHQEKRQGNQPSVSCCTEL